MVTTDTSHLSASAVSSASFVRRLLGGIILINLFVLGGWGYSLYQSYMEFDENADSMAQNLAQLLAQEVAGDLNKIDVVLLSAADEIERQSASGGIDGQALNAFLARQQGRMPEIISLRATDAKGIVLYGGGVNPAARQDNSDRDYFIRQRDNPKAGPVIVNPVFTRLDKRWAVPMSRAVHLPDGSFGGVVYVNVALDYLAKTFSTIDVGRLGSISLRDAEMRVIAVYPLPPNLDKLLGERLPIPELQELIQTGRETGSYITDRTVDRVERKFVAHKVSTFPLYVVIGRATGEYRARWREHALATMALALLFCLTTLFSSRLIYRGWRRQLDAALELAREEEKFHTVADYTYDWEYWEGPAHEILFMSPSCERVTGFAPSEFFADPELLYRIIHPDDLHLMAAHRHDIAHADEGGMDFRIVRRDGEIRWIAHGCRSVTGRDGRFMGRRASNRDVTERKQAEHEVRLAYAYNRSLIEASVDPLVTIGPDGKITDVNAATEAVTGYARERLIGTEFSDYFSDPERARSGYHRVFRDGSVRDYELELRHREGHLTPVLYNAAIYRDDSGKEIGVFAAARDISERKQAEAEVRQLNAVLEQRVAQRTAQLEAANKELEEFSYSMSHDMRTPLRAIDGYSKILLEEHGARLDDEGKRLLRAVGDNGRRMGRLIDDILSFISIGRRQIEFGAVDIAALAREKFAQLQAATCAPEGACAPEGTGAPERGTPRRLRLEVGELPVAWGDRDLLGMAMSNLLANAVKFSPADAEALIQVSGTTGESSNTYTISDRGVGFDMRYVGKLFKVFEHVHPPGQYEGTGMGLAIVKRIVELHGGRVWAEGRVGEGASFHFTLPHGRK
ncbi:MAG: PAS domain S-box protein [Sterolibacterium sp.]|jgi:PAS domain S-box-containing protein